MALKNAFDNLATESTLKRLLNLLTFSRDAQDRLRSVVDNQVVVLQNMRSSTTQMNGTPEAWYSVGSWNIVDAREDLKMQYTQTARVSKNRWTY